MTPGSSIKITLRLDREPLFDFNPSYFLLIIREWDNILKWDRDPLFDINPSEFCGILGLIKLSKVGQRPLIRFQSVLLFY